jgi:hypothetical protein
MGGDPTVAQCGACLDMQCSMEKAACNADCVAVQACIDAVCSHLSMIGSADEGACQVYCQTLHPAGKDAHLALANCVQTTACAGCAAPPYDYEQCAAAQTAGCCKGAADACASSSDCTSYQACLSSCASASDCEKCGMGSGAAGLMLYQALQTCIEQTCIAEYWLPQPP